MNKQAVLNSRRCDIVLAVLPWAPTDTPSIQLGLLKSVLDREGLSSRTAHLNVEFYTFLKNKPICTAIEKVTQYHEGLKEISPISKWLFAVPPLFSDQNTIENHFNSLKEDLAENEKESFKLILSIRQLVPDFFQQCIDDILSFQPKVVGFSCTFDQRTPSLVVAYMLKHIQPEIKIVFGGTNMGGIMGEAFIHTFPWVDVVVRGDAEYIAPQLFRELCSNHRESLSPQPGLCFRQGDKIQIFPESPDTMAAMKNNIIPDYDEYFERITGTQLEERGITRLPVESSRGCWWYKQKCKFCGRSEESLTFRPKPIEQTANDIRTLSEKYQQVDFMIVDPAIRPHYMAQLTDGLKQEGLDLSLWCQSRLNFKREDFQTLGRSGVKTIFTGIESLSTPVLKLMRKGHTALDAIQVLKWGLEYGIIITWNLIYGFPGEKAEHYEHMADLMKSLSHLNPPFQLGPLALCRSSVYFDQPNDYGITLRDPAPMDDPLYHLAHLLGKKEQAVSLAGTLKGTYEKIQDHIIENCRTVLTQWKQNRNANYGRLWYRRGQGFLDIYDYRTGISQEVFTLGETEGKIYLACDSPKTFHDIWTELPESDRETLSQEEVKSFLDQLVENRLIYEENGLYISLAVSYEGMISARGILAG